MYFCKVLYTPTSHILVFLDEVWQKPIQAEGSNLKILEFRIW